MRPRWAALLLALALVGVGREAAADRGLAIFRIDHLGVDAQIVARLEGLLRVELNRLADASMPSAARVREVLEGRPALQNCTGDVRCLSQIGKLLGVERIISGNVGGLGDDYVVNLKIVDVERGKELRKIQEPIAGQPDRLIEAVRVAAYGLVAPERLRGALTVLADQPGADVRLNGQRIGKTPLPTVRGLRVGTYNLRVSKPGYTEVTRPVRVRFQKTAQVVVKLEAPDGATPAPRLTRRPYPWYTRWWFWTAVGVVAAGAGAGLGYALAGEDKGINCPGDARCAP